MLQDVERLLDAGIAVRVFRAEPAAGQVLGGCVDVDADNEGVEGFV